MEDNIRFDSDRAPAMFIRSAFQSDWPDIEALLIASGLPTAGAKEFSRWFMVATSEGTLVGCVAEERYGEDGLLRSVAVKDDQRGKRIGTTLVEHAIGRARADGLARLTLLTETAAPFFSQFGFREIPRAEAPPAVTESIEFREACPASATTMILELRNTK